MQQISVAYDYCRHSHAAGCGGHRLACLGINKKKLLFDSKGVAIRAFGTHCGDRAAKRLYDDPLAKVPRPLHAASTTASGRMRRQVR